MENKLAIQNLTWTTDDLIKNQKNIIKPKFQRKKRWLDTPDKNNKKPSYSEYIKFLYRTENSVDPISFGIITSVFSNVLILVLRHVMFST